MNWKTQMEAARKGIITPQMEYAAAGENKTPQELIKLIAEGKVAIPANRNHKSLKPCAIGQGMRTKINVNLGISKDSACLESEMAKVRLSVDMGADAIMDLSCYGKTRDFRRHIINECSVAIGTVPMYDAIGYYDRKLEDITAKEFIKIFETHAKDGVDFMTIHAGLNRHTASMLKKSGRLTNIVSRGGSLLYVWMELTGNENPFYEYYDEILDIAREYDVTLSLGDAMRPGCIADATDCSQISELLELGMLTKAAWEKDVQVIIEGPGHMPINEIQANVLLQKKLCHGAPFYVLGPLVTDVAPGYDHITSAIGGAIAAAAGADFLCYVTPAEHLRLPDLNDVKEGIIASRIAAHAGDIAKGISGATQWDYEMSEARRNFNWNKMFSLSIDPAKPAQYRQSSMPAHEDSCTMCGDMCAVRNMNKMLGAMKE
ncbi:MAG: phosphomethylpyrimidine synthase ThiC [Eubacteriales bacterium]